MRILYYPALFILRVALVPLFGAAVAAQAFVALRSWWITRRGRP